MNEWINQSTNQSTQLLKTTQLITVTWDFYVIIIIIIIIIFMYWFIYCKQATNLKKIQKDCIKYDPANII